MVVRYSDIGLIGGSDTVIKDVNGGEIQCYRVELGL